MVILELFFLGYLDKTITPKKHQTIGKNVEFGLTDRELDYYTQFMGKKKVKPIRLEEYFKK